MSMQKKKFIQTLYDIHILMVFLLFFGLSLGLLATRAGTNRTNSITTQELLRYIEPLANAQSVKKIADLIYKMTPQTIEEVVDQVMVHPHWPLTQRDKIHLVFFLMKKFWGNVQKQRTLFDFIKKFSLMSAEQPLLYILAYSGNYQEDIPLLQKVIQSRQLDTFIKEAMEYIVKFNDIRTLERLIETKVPIKPSVADQLLWTVVKKDKNLDFVRLLASLGVDVNKVKKETTLLIRAVQDKNKPMVFELLKAGGNPNMKLNRKDTALYHAIELGYIEIEDLLRRFGGREML